MPARVNSEQFREALEAPVLLADFYSDSCVPCKRMAPLLAQLEEDHGEIRVVKVNIAYETELVERYGVHAAPTLVLFRQGQETARHTGAATAAQLEELISK